MNNLKKQISIEELHDQTQQAVKDYLQVANTSARTASNITMGVCAFFDFNSDDNISYYAESSTLALLALTDIKVSEVVRTSMGEYYYERFTKMLERIIYFTQWINDKGANIAELELQLYDHRAPNENLRIYMEIEKRKYETMRSLTELELKDWEKHDKEYGYK